MWPQGAETHPALTEAVNMMETSTSINGHGHKHSIMIQTDRCLLTVFTCTSVGQINKKDGFKES